MMRLCVQSTAHLQGRVQVPASKSQTIRGMMLALLASGESVLSNTLDANDTQDAIRVARKLGASITSCDDRLLIQSHGFPFKTDITRLNTGHSGITTRFVMPLLGLRQITTEPILLDCAYQMRERPIVSFIQALQQLGLSIQLSASSDLWPLTISGALRGGTVTLNGMSSQEVSALLIAAPCAPQPSRLMVHDLHARPYVDMTLAWLREQCIDIAHRREAGLDVFDIPGGQHYQPFTKRIAGDFSSASYLIAAAVLTPGRVELHGLDWADEQGDKRLVSLLKDMGAHMEFTSDGVIIDGGVPLQGMTIDAHDIADLLPTLAVIGAFARGKTAIINVPHARVKETDRIHSMTEGLRRMGARIDEKSDGMVVYDSNLVGTSVRGFDDHRTVMALAVAGMRATGTTWIDDAPAMDKTFPTFISCMHGLGAQMELA